MTRLHDLIIVVPGIGGSVLRREDTVIWDATPKGALRRLAFPGPLAIDTPGEVLADGLAGPFGINPFWAPFPGYDGLLNMLAGSFSPRPSIDRGVSGTRNVMADIAAFPYDFRQSATTTAQLLDDEVQKRLAARLSAGGRNRFIVVAHSLGGLVARHWLATSSQAAGSCGMLITLGTPHEGSPRALQMLAGGVRAFGRKWEGATRTLGDWPAMYELLPRYKAVLDGRKDEGTAKAPKDITLPGVHPDRVTQALAVHETIEKGWAPDGHAAHIRHVAYAGTGQSTIQGASWDGDRLTFLTGTLGWQPEGMVGGDGTVPARCAVPAGDEPIARDWSCRHGWLVELGDIAQQVQRVSGGGPYMGVEPTRGKRGLALDPRDVLLVSGDPFRATVRLLDPDGGSASAHDQPPTVRFRPARQGAAWKDATLERLGPAEWTANTPSLGTGVYQIEAADPRWLRREHPPVQELIAVMDQADVAAAISTQTGGAV